MSLKCSARCRALLIAIFLAISGGALFTYYCYQYAFRFENITIDALEGVGKPLTRMTDSEQALLYTLVNQHYRYLSEGNQVYAFESDDGEYVLKFFKFGHLKPSQLQWPHLLFGRREARKKRKINRLFEAHTAAFLHDRDNSGLLYAHLAKEKIGMPTIAVTDRYGFTHTIDLDAVFFILQRKGVPLRKVIAALLDEGQVEAAKEKLHAVLAMYVDEYRRGICDSDHNLWHNVGFSCDLPMRLDLGKVTFSERNAKFASYSEDLEKILSTRILRWLKRYYPQYEAEIMGALYAALPSLL